jgi:hypothetical protein
VESVCPKPPATLHGYPYQEDHAVVVSSYEKLITDMSVWFVMCAPLGMSASSLEKLILSVYKTKTVRAEMSALDPTIPAGYYKCHECADRVHVVVKVTYF